MWVRSISCLQLCLQAHTKSFADLRPSGLDDFANLVLGCGFFEAGRLRQLSLLSVLRFRQSHLSDRSSGPYANTSSLRFSVIRL